MDVQVADRDQFVYYWVWIYCIISLNEGGHSDDDLMRRDEESSTYWNRDA